MRKRIAPQPLAALLAVLALVLGLGPPALAQARGRCLRAEIPERYVLPDGTAHAPGELRICLERVFTPVSDLHRLSVAHGPSALFMGRAYGSELSTSDQPQVLFRKVRPGVIELIAYAWPDGNSMRLHVLEPPGKRRPRPERFEIPTVDRSLGDDGGFFALLARRD